MLAPELALDVKPGTKTGERIKGNGQGEGTNGKRKEKGAKRKVFGRLLLIDNKEGISPRDCCNAMVKAPSTVSVR